MLDTIYLLIFDMSKIASIVILVVLLVRLCLKRAPKVFSYGLWALVLFRLLCPISIETPISLIPDTKPTIQSYNLLNEPVTPLAAVDAAQQALGDVLNGGIGIQHVSTTNYDEDGSPHVISTDWSSVWILFTKFVWLGGMATLLLYSTISLIRVKRHLIGAARLRDNIFLADHIDSPFVMGLVRPKIYLPSSLSAKERDYIILHEQHHIRRGDHIIKMLSFIALCLHCFNPLVWVAFILSGKDMEMSCDEAVLRRLGEDIRADYSASLISLSTGKRIIAGAPLAFGEGNAEGRIKNIAKWKKPALWVIVALVMICAVLAICLVTNPMNRDTMLLGAEYRVAETLYHTEEYPAYKDGDLPSICITADYCLWTRNPSGGDWEFVGQLQSYTLDKKELAGYTAYEAGWVRKYSVGEITNSYILQIDGETSHNFFLAFLTKKGDILIGYGIEDISERGQGASDDTELYWLCRLESTFDKDANTGSFLDRSLAASVGGDVDIFHTWSNAYKPGYIVVGFESDDTKYNDGILIPSSEKTDMGFAVFYHNKDESGYRLLQCQVYKGAAFAENGIYLCPDPAVLDLGGEMKPDMTYDVILLKNDNIEKTTRVWEYADGTTKTESCGYLTGHEMVLFSWENEHAECRVSQYFYDAHGELIDYSNIIKNASAQYTIQDENLALPSNTVPVISIRSGQTIASFQHDSNFAAITDDNFTALITDSVSLYFTCDRIEMPEILSLFAEYPQVLLTFEHTNKTISIVNTETAKKYYFLYEGRTVEPFHTVDDDERNLKVFGASDYNGDGTVSPSEMVEATIPNRQFVYFTIGQEIRNLILYRLIALSEPDAFVCDAEGNVTYTPLGTVFCKDGTTITDRDGNVLYPTVSLELRRTVLIPTAANVSGAFDGYLYVPIDGANYRYERIFESSASIKKGTMIHTFIEEADPQNVEWRIYSVEGYPNYSLVLADAGSNYIYLYRYSPAKAVDPDRLTAIKASGMITLEDRYATSGEDVWDSFYEKTQNNTPASVKIAHYYTLENSNYDAKYYEAYKEDYPALYEFTLTYDGGIYTLAWNDFGIQYVRNYKYLKQFEGTLPLPYSLKEPQKVTRYVLTNDNADSWDDIVKGISGSQLGEYIDHYTIFSTKN